jgi:alpha-galactosidase/6-phospho-beta-glucosidase family protein
MSDLALCPRLSGEISLFDIDAKAAEANVAVGASIFGHRNAVSHFSVRAVDSLRGALEGASFVVLSIEPGPTELRYADLEIPRKYGILQPVGDTTGPGGLLRSLRAVPIFEGFAHEIMAVCPDAWVINYTNPMSVCTAALYAAEPAIKAFGCCHEVAGVQARLAELVSTWHSVPAPPRKEIWLEISGLNHFTFAVSAEWNGVDLLKRLREEISRPDFFKDRTEKALTRREEERWFESDGLIALDFLRNFGALGAAGDRHLAEFVPWYLTSEEDLWRWGVVLTPYEWRVRRMRSLSSRAADEPLAPSGEEGAWQIRALLGLGPLVTNVNLPNRGQVWGLPEGTVVETNARFDARGVHPICPADLPSLLLGHIRGIAQVQAATLRAAKEKDRGLALQALLCDPLVRIQTGRARLMFDEMLDYAKDWLPGWGL